MVMLFCSVTPLCVSPENTAHLSALAPLRLLNTLFHSLPPPATPAPLVRVAPRHSHMVIPMIGIQWRSSAYLVLHFPRRAVFIIR
jgi:hypothetical protein